MSRSKERIHKDCLNCNAEVQGRFCQQCGQENIEPKETVWHLITHFFKDITHFDGKFFSTIRLLILKPGFLSQQYMIGKRTSFLNPVRLYVFTSAVFFLIFFLVNGSAHETDEGKSVAKSNEKHMDYKDSLLSVAKQSLKKNKSGKYNSIVSDKQGNQLEMIVDTLKNDTTVNFKLKSLSDISLFVGDEYESLAAYDSAQASLPPVKKDKWLKNKFQRRQYALNDKFKNDKQAINKALLSKTLHNFPKVFFLSLPIFALLLKLVYFRRKQFYYVDHAIFTIHLYCAAFIILLVSLGISEINDNLNWGFFDVVEFLLFLTIIYYEFKAIRKFYGQSFFKSLLKLFIVNILMLFIFIILSLSVFIFSAYQI